MFGKRTGPLPLDPNKQLILGMMWGLKAPDISNLEALRKLVEDGKEDIVFGTTRASAFSVFWEKLINLELAKEAPSLSASLMGESENDPQEYIDDMKENLVSYAPTKDGAKILIDLLPLHRKGWPPQGSVISPETIEILRRNVTQGVPMSQTKLALLLENGIVVDKNLAEAFRLHKAAAEGGSPVSMDALAEMYFRGNGTTTDHKEALKWFKEAADYGHPPAMLKLGHVYVASEDFAHAYIWYSLAAKWGMDCTKERDNALQKLDRVKCNAAELFLQVWTPQSVPQSVEFMRNPA